MTRDPKGWFCDKCGELIQSKQRGCVEWITRRHPTEKGRRTGVGIRIVHSGVERVGGCQYDPQLLRAVGCDLSDLPIDRWLGADGLMNILYKVSEGEWPIEEAVQLIKRLHTPGYEHARRHFDAAFEDGVLERDAPHQHACYSQREIGEVLSRYCG